MKFILTLWLSFLVLPALAASPCNCSHTIGLDTYMADGKRLKVQAGDTVCIEAGRRPYLRLENFEGTAEEPIVFQNCGGKVTLGGPAVNDGIKILNSRHFRLTGTGDSAHTYGIHIVESRPGSQGVAVYHFSSDFEIDHIEIEKAGFAGIMAKTDPNCEGTADRGAFTMYNVSLHDNYIHDVGGEGIYLGNSFYLGTKVYCDTFHLPHEVKGVRVFNNRVENTGWDAIQVGSAVEDVEIFCNQIRNYGTANKHAQNQAIQLGLGTTGRTYNNKIFGGSGPGIVVQGIGDNFVYNNLIVNPGQEAFNVNTRQTLPGKGVYIINNTVVGAQNGVIREYVNKAANNVFYNNLIVNSSNDWNHLKPYTDWTIEHNLLTDVGDVVFEAALENNYGLSQSSRAIDAGKDVSAYGIKTDLLSNPRPQGSSYDIGAFEYAPTQQ
ncbi:right-handed parallel beta-helix repeat-containing protein [Nafulsella turpanensis]|uniref:right-handed parallel beta-helix repeat-containing protein n=1 Tax=Nafulsella turpanensis TaxID=1265690 RepID=UPI00034AD9FD|nr:right-handed parallel beta-helix repeat-containing protein [Nafulsella turpanensis]